MIKFRHLENLQGYGHFGDDFMKVSRFLASLQKDQLKPLSFPWGRWEWMFSLPYLDADHLNSIGVWEDRGNIVALITYESKFGEAYYVLNDLYPYLRKEVASFALKELQGVDGFRMLIPDHDHDMQRVALSLGLRATEEREMDSVLDLYQKLDYELPEGYKVQSLKENPDVKRYHQILWRGFNHQGEPTMTEQELTDRRISLSGPHVNLDRNIAVVAPLKEFVSYCGTWYIDGDEVVLIEPVATDPHYRKMGLGKAAVFEALKRCKEKGARYALVGSGQEFYFKLGFYPYVSYTWWKLDQK